MQHFFLDDDEPPVAGSRPDGLSAESVPQEGVQRHTVEQMGDVVPVVPVLIAPVPLLGSCEVGCALRRWEPLPPPVRVRPSRELAADLHRDLPRLEEVRQRTAIEVARWGCELVRRGVSLMSAEIFAMASLLPDFRGRATARLGRYTNTGRRAEAGAGATDPGEGRGSGGSSG